MELEFETRTTDYLRQSIEGVCRQEQTLEVIVPDASPDAARVVYCGAQAVVRSRECRSGAIELTGGIQAGAVYLTEADGAPRTLTAWLPFTLRLEHPAAKDDTQILMDCRVLAADARLVNSRKILFRAEVGAQIMGFAADRIELPLLKQTPPELQLRCRNYPLPLPAETADIYEMFTAAMLRPLPPRRQKFLAVMCLADEFTGEMARFITKEPDTAEILSDLTAKNAFVTCLPGGGYRFHHMMKACAQRDFDALPPQEQAAYQARYGHWYAENGQYLQALAAYSKAGRWDDALEVVQQDAGILLAALRPQQVLELLDRCGDQVLMEHPTALLVLMRRMFTWGQIPRMQQLKELLLESVRRHPELTDRQLEALCRQVREFTLPVTGTCGFDQAQVTAGGLRTEEFHPETLESRVVPGLYACGEVLDVDGDCGGFNLQWAWSSGHLAGLLL